MEFCIRECARLGLEFTMNVAASGGSMISYIDGKPYEADVLDRNDILAHLDRVFGPILKRVADLKASGISDYGVVKASGIGERYLLKRVEFAVKIEMSNEVSPHDFLLDQVMCGSLPICLIA